MTLSLKKVISVVIALTVMCALAIPATFVSATVAPEMKLSIVDANGNDVATLVEEDSYFLRVDVSGLEVLYAAGVKISATGAVFGPKEDLVKRYSEYNEFKDSNNNDILEISTSNGVTASADTMEIEFTKSMSTTGTLPVMIESFTLVDIPFTVSATAGDNVEFTFATGTNDTHVQVSSSALTGKYTIGHSSRPLAAEDFAATVVPVMYTITNLEVIGDIPEIPAGVDEIDLSGVYARVTYESNSSAVEGGMNDYQIVLEATENMAHLNIADLNFNQKATYQLPVTVYDSFYANSPYTVDDAATVVVGDPVRTGEVKADVSKVVEVKYGADEQEVVAAIADRTDLFKDVYTDGSEQAGSYTVTDIDITLINTNFPGDYTAEVRALSDNPTITDGIINVKVVNPSIASIELTPAWDAYPEQEAGATFPGFDGYKILATYKPETSAVATKEFDIVTDFATAERAYIDVSSYKANVAGTYTLPVSIDSEVFAYAYTDEIRVAVDPAEPTGRVKADTTKVVEIRYNSTPAQMLEQIAAHTDLFKDIYTNGTEVEKAYTVKSVDVSTVVADIPGNYTATVTALEENATIVSGVINIKVKEPEKAIISGSVRVSDTTGQVLDVADAIPVGAVVLAIPTNAELMENYISADTNYGAKATLVDNEGNFRIEVDEGDYTIVITHTKFTFYEGEALILKSILDSDSLRNVRVALGDNLNLGRVNLKYAYFGDLDLDGTLNGNDYAYFTMNFGETIN